MHRASGGEFPVPPLLPRSSVWYIVIPENKGVIPERLENR